MPRLLTTRGCRHTFVFAVFVFLVSVGIVNILFATDWLLPDYFFSDWDPYDHLFDGTDSHARIAAPLLGDYVDDARFQYSSRTVKGILTQGQDDVVLTWRAWLKGSWRGLATTPSSASSSSASSSVLPHDDRLTDSVADAARAESVPTCPWPSPELFQSMPSQTLLGMRQMYEYWRHDDAMAQLQLRFDKSIASGADLFSRGLDDHESGSESMASADGAETHSQRSDAVRSRELPHVYSPEMVADLRLMPLPKRLGEVPGAGTGTAAVPDYEVIVREADIGKNFSRKVRYFDFPRAPALRAPHHPWTHFYVAVNLYKNEQQIPFLTAALVAWLEDEVRPFFDVATSVVVTIYANAADVETDPTATLIETLLVPELHRVGVKTIFAATRGTCLGKHRGEQGVERIEWMSCVRNKALTPLYEMGMDVFQAGHKDRRNGYVPTSTSTDNADTDKTSAAMPSHGLVVLFLNDVFFRPQDLTRLLESKREPGMPPTERVTDGVVRTEHRATPVMASPSSSSASASPGQATMGFDMACAMDFYFNLYDTWVARDRLGHVLHAAMPYVADVPTQDAFQRIFDGLASSRGRGHEDTQEELRRHAVPVKSCWNGVAAIRGNLFLPVVRAAAAESPRDDSAAFDVPKRDASPQNSTARGEWLYQYFLRLQLRRISSKRTRWLGVCAKQSQKHGAAVPECDLPLQLFVEDDVPTLLHAMNECEAYEGDEKATRGAGQGGRYCAVARDLDDAGRDDGATRLAQAKTLAPYHSLTFPLQSAAAALSPRHAPAVRFRHPFAPSYGAVHVSRVGRDGTWHETPLFDFNSEASIQTETVVDDVCFSSECQLICQDVQHAVMLRHHRLPIILMNPSVRVVYEASDVDRVLLSGWYESPWLYRLMRRFATLQRRLTDGLAHPWRPAAPRWWRLLLPSALISPHQNTAPGEETYHGFMGTHRLYSPKQHMRKTIGATDDWLRPEAIEARENQLAQMKKDEDYFAREEKEEEGLLRLMVPVDATATTATTTMATTTVALVNVTQLTRMDCQDALLAGFSEPPMIAHALVRLLVLALSVLALWGLCRCANQESRVVAAGLMISPRGLESRGVNDDVLWWSKLCRTTHRIWSVSVGRLGRGSASWRPSRRRSVSPPPEHALWPTRQGLRRDVDDASGFIPSMPAPPARQRQTASTAVHVASPTQRTTSIDMFPSRPSARVPASSDVAVAQRAGGIV